MFEFLLFYCLNGVIKDLYIKLSFASVISCLPSLLLVTILRMIFDALGIDRADGSVIISVIIAF